MIRTSKILVYCILALLIGLIIFGCASCNYPTAYAKNDEFLLKPDRDYLILVNDDHPYEFGGEYDRLLQGDLDYLPDVYGEATPVEPAAAQAFLDLQADLAQRGTIIGLYSGYLSESDQQWVYDYYGNLEGWSETNTVRKPGFSEHHTGLLLNILIWHSEHDWERPTWYTETAERQASIPDFQVVHEALADHGFIDRYPAGKELITGVLCEPYEIRFVGSSEIAHYIQDNALTLEEYLDEITKQK